MSGLGRRYGTGWDSYVDSLGVHCKSDELPTWMKQTRLVRDWQAIRHEVETHKWLESERAGRDVGWDRAYTDWMIRYRGEFFRAQIRCLGRVA